MYFTALQRRGWDISWGVVDCRYREQMMVDDAKLPIGERVRFEIVFVMALLCWWKSVNSAMRVPIDGRSDYTTDTGVVQVMYKGAGRWVTWKWFEMEVGIGNDAMSRSLSFRA